MSAPISVSNSPIQSVSEWRKRTNSGEYTDNSIIAKRQRCQYYYILASESSRSEDEGSESVDSIQDQETDLCKDTTDTDTKSEQSDDDYDMKVEYEIVSSSEPEENPFADGSSSGEDALIAAGAVAATISKESDVEIWVTDGDDESDSVTSIIESQFLNCQKCRRCKIRETVSGFLCSHCYQIRKNCRPSRPRHRKPKSQELRNSSGSVTTEGLSACLNVLSQDSGLGSSQDMQSSSSQLQTLAWDKVVVPENLINSTNSMATASVSSLQSTDSSSAMLTDQTMENWKSAANEMCIMCNAMPKNGIFVHSTTGHLCCCYNCAVKFWTKSKRCAWCNLKAKNVVKAFLV